MWRLPLARTPRVISFLAAGRHHGPSVFPSSISGKENCVGADRKPTMTRYYGPGNPPSIKASALGDWALFLAVYYCASGHHEWIKTKRGSEVARVDRGGGRRGCVRSRKRRGNDFLPPRRERYTTRMERNYPSWKILSSRLSRDEIDDWRASYLSGRLNISNGRNFRWMRTKFAKWVENVSIGSLAR